MDRRDCYPWLSCVSSSIFFRNVLIAAKVLTRLQVPLMLGDSSQLWESSCQFAWYLSKIKMFLTGRLCSYFKCPVFTECAAGSFRGRELFLANSDSFSSHSLSRQLVPKMVHFRVRVRKDLGVSDFKIVCCLALL